MEPGLIFNLPKARIHVKHMRKLLALTYESKPPTRVDKCLC